MLSHFSRVQRFMPHGLGPGRPLCPWDPPGKNAGVGCPAFLRNRTRVSRQPALAGGSLPQAPRGKPGGPLLLRPETEGAEERRSGRDPQS